MCGAVGGIVLTFRQQEYFNSSDRFANSDRFEKSGPFDSRHFSKTVGFSACISKQ
jgi:hypothetical protein